MKPQCFIFIGASGCGKGTQVEKLMDYLKSKDSNIPILYIQTGAEFRNFVQGDSYTQKLAREILEKGGLQPEFVTVHQWIKVMIEKYTGKEHIIFDGTPRKHHEAGILNSIIDFYGLEKPHVIHMQVSIEEATKRLLDRKRADDTEEDIRNRLSWFETDVKPTIDYFRDNPSYTFIEVNGEGSVEGIHDDIVSHLSFR